MNIGIDIGSRTIKVAVIDNGMLVEGKIEPSGFDPKTQAAGMLYGYPDANVVATGYGRHLARKHFAHEVITEIKAHAIGVLHYHPDCRTVIDVGGQDAKVILLDAQGRVDRFLMNDKCAAGTGRFMEIMAASLGYSLDEFGHVAASSDRTAPVNSMCTVFAESEVISLRNNGVPPEDIARAIHLTVVDRLVSMLDRLGWKEPIAFSGGVARNGFIRSTLGERLKTGILSVDQPDIIGALGAALHSFEKQKD